jgi:hypothetical protein
MEAVIEYIKVHESVQSICHNTTYKRKQQDWNNNNNNNNKVNTSAKGLLGVEITAASPS